VIPEPGPKQTLRLTIDGYTTYVYASANRQRRAVASEEARWMPGMFEKYVTLSPDNRTLTWARTIRSKTDRMLFYAADVDGGNVRLLADLPWELWVARPAWSPDSRRIAYVRATSPGEKPGLELWTVDADGGNNRKLLSHPSFRAEIFYGTDPQPLRWTKYGDIQYKDYTAGKLWTVHGETGKLASSTLAAKPPRVDIPVVKTKNPIPIQSQNDPRWRYDFMDPEPNSLGSFGCALADVSMTFNAHGIPMDPKTLNKKMGDHAAIFEWGYAEYVSDYRLNVSNQQWAFDWYALDLALSRGWPTLVWLADASTTDAALLTHWVLVVGGGGQTPDGYRIYDPWDGSTYKTLAYYTDKGYGLQRAYAYAPVSPKKKADDAPAGKRKKRDDR
jgi:hypothetical protein